MKLPFTKMHGAGNDFIFLNALEHELPEDLSAFSKQICHRRFGIGADQVLIVAHTQEADFRMEIYNADGGQVEMCGNGIRCFAKYVRDQGLTDQLDFSVETLAGLIKPSIILKHPKKTKDTMWVKVDMGEPILEAKKIPTLGSGQLVSFEFSPQRAADLPEGFQKFKITTVSMGNPHCVIFVDDVQSFPVEKVGSIIENDPFFPKRTNVEFVQIKSRKHMLQRTWERGAGETYACGTGACAVIVAAILNDFADRSAVITLKGGDLDLSWDQASNHVFKTGPATTVFEGKIEF